MADRTSLTKAASNTTSLRTTVPSTIVKQFSLVDGDELEWSLIAEAEGKMGIKVVPCKQETASMEQTQPLQRQKPWPKPSQKPQASTLTASSASS